MELRKEQKADGVVGQYTSAQWLASADLVAGAFRNLPPEAFAVTVIDGEDGEADADDTDAATADADAA